MISELHAMADRTTILRGLVGSTIHGLHVDDGLEDRDEMAVCVENINHVVGLEPFEQVVYRTAAIREDKHDAKSRAGDLDLVTYSLRKYVRLALNSNPTILNLLFVPHKQCTVRDARGAGLQELAPAIVSRKAGSAFLGYLTAQKQRLLGLRGQKDVNRPELVEKYGFDTKYAMHLLRLGYQGIELLETGRLSLPMREPERSLVRAVRTGAVPLSSVLVIASELERLLANLRETSPLPAEPDTARVEAWMIRTYFETWKARDPSWTGARARSPLEAILGERL